MAADGKVTLAGCPIGLFVSDCGKLCLKTEYGANAGRIDAYIVESGEFFWGAEPQTVASQRSQLVTPVEVVATRKPEDAPFPPFDEIVSAAVETLTLLDDWTNVNETEFTGWGDGIVPPSAEFMRVKSGQALKALKEIVLLRARAAAQETNHGR